MLLKSGAYNNVFKKRLLEIASDAEDIFTVTPKKSIRINTLKAEKEEIVKKLSDYIIEEMPWYEHGLWVRDEISKTIEHHLGYFYIQEAASMLSAIVLSPSKHEFIVDMCAAPGSKTTQMAMMMDGEGVIIANDVNSKRIKALAHNVQRGGAKNVIITNYDARYMPAMEADKILLDAPCTASGKIMYENVQKKWNYNRIRIMSRKQKQLMKTAYRLLRKEGEMVYSTCSLEPEENEEVIDFAIKELGMKTLPFRIEGIKMREAITSWREKEFDDSIKNCRRVWPQDNGTEGFFICKLKKF